MIEHIFSYIIKFRSYSERNVSNFSKGDISFVARKAAPISCHHCPIGKNIYYSHNKYSVDIRSSEDKAYCLYRKSNWPSIPKPVPIPAAAA
jgi:hypothetical protein